jgi:hypothetical protein
MLMAGTYKLCEKHGVQYPHGAECPKCDHAPCQEARHLLVGESVKFKIVVTEDIDPDSIIESFQLGQELEVSIGDIKIKSKVHEFTFGYDPIVSGSLRFIEVTLGEPMYGH